MDRKQRRHPKFQSTPSARRATLSTRRPDGARVISIHALREEGDTAKKAQPAHPTRFQSTPSARRATSKAGDLTPAQIISIHALREEGD